MALRWIFWFFFLAILLRVESCPLIYLQYPQVNSSVSISEFHLSYTTKGFDEILHKVKLELFRLDKEPYARSAYEFNSSRAGAYLQGLSPGQYSCMLSLLTKDDTPVICEGNEVVTPFTLFTLIDQVPSSPQPTPQQQPEPQSHPPQNQILPKVNEVDHSGPLHPNLAAPLSAVSSQELVQHMIQKQNQIVHQLTEQVYLPFQWPLVTIVTVTHGRQEMLTERCIPSVLKQDYPNLEYIIISDGPDAELENHLASLGYPKWIKFFQLGRNWQTWYPVKGWGAIPRKVATYLGRGDYFMYLDDDNEFLHKDHVMRMVAFMLGLDTQSPLPRGIPPTPLYDFVYCMAEVSHVLASGKQGRYHKGIFGNAPLQHGHIDTSLLLVSANVLKVHNWEAAGYSSDWEVIKKWADNSLRAGFMDNYIGVRYHVALRGDRAIH